MLLPLGYLLIRTSTADQEAIDLLLRPRTLQLAFQTFALAATVTAGTVLIALPLAWLTVRTDLPGRRIWSVVVSLPLVIPSYVGGFVIIAALGPRGILQQALAEPFGIQRLPEIYGFPGAALALILFTFPYVLLSVQAGLQMLDPALEETSRSLGSQQLADVQESNFTPVAAVHLRRRAAGRPLRPQRLRRCIPASVRLLHSGDLCTVSVIVRSYSGQRICSDSGACHPLDSLDRDSQSRPRQLLSRWHRLRPRSAPGDGQPSTVAMAVHHFLRCSWRQSLW